MDGQADPEKIYILHAVWFNRPNGPHRYLTADAQQCIRVTELFVALCSQPPCLGPLDRDGSENE